VGGGNIRRKAFCFFG